MARQLRQLGQRRRGAPASWPTSPTPGGGNAPSTGGGGCAAAARAPPPTRARTRARAVAIATEPGPGTDDAPRDTGPDRAAGDQPARDRRDDTAASAAAAVQRLEVPVIDTRLSRCSRLLLVRTARAAMGSVAHVVVGDAPDGVVDWALQELERLEQCWSRFRTDSELSRAQREPGRLDRRQHDADARAHVRGRSASRHRRAIRPDDPRRARARRLRPHVRPRRRTLGCRQHRPAPVPGFAHVEIDEEQSRVRLPPRHPHRPRRRRQGPRRRSRRARAHRPRRPHRSRRHGRRSARPRRGAAGRRVGRSRARPVRRDPRGVPIFAHGRRDRDEYNDDACVDPRESALPPPRRPARRAIRRAPGSPPVVAAANDAWWAEGIAKSIIIGGADAGRELAQSAGVRAWIFLDDGRVLDSGATP